MNARGVVAAIGVLLVTGCRGAEKAGLPAPAQNRARDETARRFVPPVDGRLTAQQVDQFARWLHSTGRRGPEVFISDPADLEKIESAGSDSPGTEELSWVRSRVLAALLDIQSGEAGRRALETYRKTLEGLRHALAVATDPATRQTLAGQIKDIEAELSREEASAAHPLPPDAAANAALVSPRRKELEKLAGLP